MPGSGDDHVDMCSPVDVEEVPATKRVRGTVTTKCVVFTAPRSVISSIKIGVPVTRSPPSTRTVQPK